MLTINAIKEQEAGAASRIIAQWAEWLGRESGETLCSGVIQVETSTVAFSLDRWSEGSVYDS